MSFGGLKKGIGFLPGILIVSLLVTGLFALFYYASNITVPESSTTPPVVHQTWETYDNNQYRYSFSYPSDYSAWDHDGITSLESEKGTMTLKYLLGPLDPDNIRDGATRPEVVGTLSVGKHTGYEYHKNVDGCDEDVIQTDLPNQKILRMGFLACEGQTNDLITNTKRRRAILATFQFND